MTTPSDPAKHAEAVEYARRLKEAATFLNSCEIRREAMDGRMISSAGASIVLASTLRHAAAYLDSLPGDGGELADVKFCKSVGIRENIRGPEKGFSGLTCVSVCSAEGSVAITHWKNHLSPYNILYRPTRRQVRAIAAALTPLTPAIGGEG